MKKIKLLAEELKQLGELVANNIQMFSAKRIKEIIKKLKATALDLSKLLNQANSLKISNDWDAATKIKALVEIIAKLSNVDLNTISKSMEDVVVKIMAANLHELNRIIAGIIISEINDNYKIIREWFEKYPIALVRILFGLRNERKAMEIVFSLEPSKLEKVFMDFDFDYESFIYYVMAIHIASNKKTLLPFANMWCFNISDYELRERIRNAMGRSKIIRAIRNCRNKRVNITPLFEHLYWSPLLEKTRSINEITETLKELKEGNAIMEIDFKTMKKYVKKACEEIPPDMITKTLEEVEKILDIDITNKIMAELL